MRRRFLQCAGAIAVAAIAPIAIGELPRRRLGILGHGDADNFLSAGPDRFLDALARLGYARGRNLEVQMRWSGGDGALLAGLARELVAMNPDALVTEGTSPTRALQQATRTVPIVTTVGDPVAYGFARELSHPGGNITGLSQARGAIAAKQVEMLRAMLPGLDRMAIIYLKSLPRPELFVRPVEDAARAAGIATRNIAAPDEEPGGLVRAIEECAENGIHAALSLFVGGPRYLEAALRHRVALMVMSAEAVSYGALCGIEGDSGTDIEDIAAIVHKVLGGADPATIPFAQPTRFIVAVNAKAAEQMGIRLSPEVLLRADRVIREIKRQD